MPGVDANPYAVLGVAEDCPREELKRAYRELARLYHPDRNDGAEWATERWKLVNEAYAAITKPQPRRIAHADAPRVVSAPRAAIVVTAAALAAIALGSGFVLGHATGADANAARVDAVANARHAVAAEARREFSRSFRHARAAAYRRAYSSTVRGSE
jgi:curved DNA-binding protein CbpA